MSAAGLEAGLEVAMSRFVSSLRPRQTAAPLAAPLLPVQCAAHHDGDASAESRPPLAGSVGAAARERVPLLDNAKAALIYLVVVYHTLVVYTSADRPEGIAPPACGIIPVWSAVLALLKPVVMPSFCLISGHLSCATLSARRGYELCQLVAAYLLFQTLYHTNNLLAYRLNGFAFRALPLQLGCASFLVAASAGTVALARRGERGFGGVTFADAFAGVSETYDCFNGFAPDAARRRGGCATLRAAGQRAAFYAASAPLMAGFFSVLPRAAGWWSHPGHMSMFIYLLHPLLITNPYVMRAVFERLSALSGREVNVWSPADDGAVVSAVLPASLAVCALLSTPPVRRLLGEGGSS
ncbi:hypothetical protein EMIHUDRAFT_459834 [Emiliania huxleyi CCMP1516]|uniref:Acyltransferase 3 domain-containing protein n=2 Tax=Emiliania huxleyi TaxID=2903 RepID=A0A0D3IH25_EMIH1|nr:hypothetical protein EMIHUDRAFT_459834 [Emiliania huxleyi CCMP1516]EOD10560.1 hypothetical protein EMIHUDRAFT_459834 [Emiliania huxleyi CCMP1516]|eukprot:XP_005762989.1 hypothetical protein EMIHUDRAFT_459834 [Emiliania huxleyi CCMP1516]